MDIEPHHQADHRDNNSRPLHPHHHCSAKSVELICSPSPSLSSPSPPIPRRWSPNIVGGSLSASSLEERRKEPSEKSWIDNSQAWDHFCAVLTSLYALFTIVFAAVVELSQQFSPDEWFSETLFHSYMYGAGIVFLLYSYVSKGPPAGWLNRLTKFVQKRRLIGGFASDLDQNLPKIGRNVEGAGSLYLRLGTLCFGSSGIVLFCLEIFICFSDRNCFSYQLVNWLFAGIFTFIQMHFIFCNSKLIIIDSKNAAKLGTMHLLAVNIWTWLRFVVAKNAALDRPLDNQPFHFLLQKHVTNNLSSEKLESDQHQMMFLDMDSTPSRFPSKLSSFNYFGDFASLLTTCIVEYSVIGAALMVTLWRSIDENNSKHKTGRTKDDEEEWDKGVTKQAKNGKSVRIDCSASSGGLFAGLLFLIASLVSIGIHSFFSQHEDSDGALLVFRLSDMALFCCTLVGCSVGLIKMRSLQYHHGQEQRCSNAEFLDEILLIIGLVGELIHSSTGVMCWIATQAERAPAKMELYMLFVFIMRIVQVIVQAVFILLARRLRALSARAQQDKPGKQFVTFLLIANLSLFFFHTLEGMNSVFGATIATRRARPYAALIVAVAPLVVFYRFHSSVCLAEIWKHCYSAKNHQQSSGSQSQSSIPTDLTSLNTINLMDRNSSSGQNHHQLHTRNNNCSLHPETSSSRRQQHRHQHLLVLMDWTDRQITKGRNCTYE